MHEAFTIGEWDETLFEWVQDTPVPIPPSTAVTGRDTAGVSLSGGEARRNHRSRGDLPRWLSANEVAEMLQLERHTVYRLLRDGQLPGTKIGGQWFVTVDRLARRLRGEA
jgi:excisionase family DNA binding protein